MLFRFTLQRSDQFYPLCHKDDSYEDLNFVDWHSCYVKFRYFSSFPIFSHFAFCVSYPLSSALSDFIFMISLTFLVISFTFFTVSFGCPFSFPCISFLPSSTIFSLTFSSFLQIFLFASCLSNKSSQISVSQIIGFILS